MIRVAVLLALSLTLACTAEEQPDRAPKRPPATTRTDSASWVVSFTGYGPIRVGHERVEMQAVLGAPPRAGMGEPAEECKFVAIPNSSLSRVAHAMVVHDTVVRVDIDSLPVATAWGDRVGDDEAAVMGRHRGQVRVEPHPYTGPEGHYLIVTSPNDSMYRLIFETDGKHVVSYRAGLRPAVDWIEGCS